VRVAALSAPPSDCATAPYCARIVCRAFSSVFQRSTWYSLTV
jgi:hypothetical protein